MNDETRDGDDTRPQHAPGKPSRAAAKTRGPRRRGGAAAKESTAAPAATAPTAATPRATPAARSPRARPASRPRPQPAVVTGQAVQPTASAPAEPAAGAPLYGTQLDVRWGDMDAFNHVNNARFLGYLEEARLRWLQSLPGPWLDEDVAPVLAAVNVNYRRPIQWPATLAIELAAGRIGSTSLTLAHRIVDAADAGVLYSDGHVVMVWIDRRSGRAAALPEAVRRGCQRLV